MHQSPLPRRIVWFAPWTWKRRWWIALVLAGLMVEYPLVRGRYIALQWTGGFRYRPLWKSIDPFGGWKAASPVSTKSWTGTCNST